MTHEWNIYYDRVKYVFDETEVYNIHKVYICLDGTFHSWGYITEDNEWSFQTVEPPIKEGKHLRISVWLESCLNDT